MGRPSSAVTMVALSLARRSRIAPGRVRSESGWASCWCATSVARLAIDCRGDDSADEVDVLGAERCRLGKPQPGVSAEQDRGSDASGYGVVQRPDLLGGCDVRSLLPCAWRRPAGAGIAGNDAVMHGVAEELREANVEGVGVRVGPSLSLELGGPATDV